MPILSSLRLTVKPGSPRSTRNMEMPSWRRSAGPRISSRAATSLKAKPDGEILRLKDVCVPPSNDGKSTEKSAAKHGSIELGSEFFDIYSDVNGRPAASIVLKQAPGSNAAEFRMFGQEINEHADRYAMAQEWWDIVRRIWTSEREFDFHGAHFKLQGVFGRPLPFGGNIPPVMNAGASPVGRDFAIRNSDMHYDWCDSPETSRDRIKESKARAVSKSFQVWAPISVVCRPTQREVNEFLNDCVANADWAAIERRNASRLSPRGSKSQSAESVAEIRQHDEARAVIARDHYSIFGTPDRVASELARMSDAGFVGQGVDYLGQLVRLPGRSLTAEHDFHLSDRNFKTQGPYLDDPTLDPDVLGILRERYEPTPQVQTVRKASVTVRFQRDEGSRP